MSKGNESYFAMTCHGPDVPWSCLHKTDTGEFVTVYERNADLVAKVGSYDLPQVEWMSFNVTNSDQKVSASLILHVICDQYWNGFGPDNKMSYFFWIYTFDSRVNVE